MIETETLRNGSGFAGVLPALSGPGILLWWGQAPSAGPPAPSRHDSLAPHFPPGNGSWPTRNRAGPQLFSNRIHSN